VRFRIIDLWRVFVKEVTCFVRDRNILLYTIVFPIFLYPITFWVMNQVMLFQKGSVESRVSRVTVIGDALAPELVSLLETKTGLTVTRVRPGADPPKAEIRLEIDSPVSLDRGICSNIRLYYDQTDDYSVNARDRVLESIEDYRRILVRYRASEVNLPGNLAESYEVIPVNIASSETMGAFIVGMLMPMMIVIMAAMGTLYPSIELIVGEREKNTLETTLLVPTPRLILMGGKFAAIIVSGLTAVLLNIFSLGVTAGHTLFLMDDKGSAMFTIPPRAYPLIIFSSLIISAGFGACGIIISSFARNFREAQSYMSPFFIISFQPAILASMPGVTLTWMIALVPIANAAVMFREIINGTYQWPKIALTLISLAVLSLIAVAVAAFRLTSEQTLLGPRSKESADSTPAVKKRWQRFLGI
jgi:sodium transport system permease protein